MKLTLRLLGAEVLDVEITPAVPPPPGPTPSPEPGLDEDGAPRVHETHLAADTQLGFRAGTPRRLT